MNQTRSKYSDKIKPITYALAGTIAMMVLTTCLCMYVVNKPIEHTENVYRHFKQFGFTITNHYDAIYQSKLVLLQITLSEPLCILAILLMGIATFVAILLDNQGMNE